MSNIYIQEPPALGKVLLKTTVGDIDIELWTRETPKTCRNFVQLCMEGYYNGTIFHRVVPDFIVQGGDPKGDGTGGESIYDGPFKDEFHTRLRFSRRGLVAMANSGKNDNGSQFFFTLNSTPELQNKHTIFGKVTGDTVYNMLKLAEGEIDHNERPVYPHKITSCKILINPFEDIIPRTNKKVDTEELPEKKIKEKEKGVKNFGLLSFGMEAEEDEDQSTEFRGKPKSTHDVLDDPKLSKLTGLESIQYSDSDDSEIDEKNAEATLNLIKEKLSKKKVPEKPKFSDDIDEEIDDYYLGKDKKEARKKQAEEIRKEIKNLKREMLKSNQKEEIQPPPPEKKVKNVIMQEYEDEHETYKKKLDKIPKKGASREQFTLELLNKFKKKLDSAKTKINDSEQDKEEDEEIDNDDWLAHKLHFEDKGEVLAKDASTKGDDWYNIYDPRNPINKRKREKGKEGHSKS